MMPPIAPMVPHLSRTVGNGGDWWADGLNIHTRPSMYTSLWIVEGDMLLMYMSHGLRKIWCHCFILGMN